MEFLLAILAFGTLGAVTIWGLMSAQATSKHLEKTHRGEKPKSSLSPDGMQERREHQHEQEAARQPS